MHFVVAGAAGDHVGGADLLEGPAHIVQLAAGHELLFAELLELLGDGNKVVVWAGDGKGEDLQPLDKGPGTVPPGVLKDLLRGAVLVDHALVHVEHPGGYIPRELHLVGDDHHGEPLGRQLPDDRKDLPHHGGVQGAGGLVEEDDLRLHGQGPGDGRPLLLAAGELVGVAESLFRHAHGFQKAHGPLIGLLPGHLPNQGGGQHEVLDDGQVVKEVELLEHHPHAAAKGAEVRLFVADILPVD